MCYSGSPEIVAQLLDWGSDINAEDEVDLHTFLLLYITRSIFIHTMF